MGLMKLAKKAARINPLMTGAGGAAVGGLFGGVYGGFSDNGSVLGGAFNGATVGGMLGLGGGAAARYGGVGVTRGLGKFKSGAMERGEAALHGVSKAGDTLTNDLDDMWTSANKWFAGKSKASKAHNTVNSNSGVNPI